MATITDTFLVLDEHLGKTIQAKLVATNTAGSVELSSTATAPVAAAPSLQALTLSASSFPVGSAAGTVIAAIQNRTVGSTLTVTPNDGRVVVSGSNLLVGLSASTVGATSYTITETLAGASNTPRASVVSVTCAPPAPTLAWITPANDTTPTFIVSMTGPATSDTVTFQIDTVSNFASATGTDDTVDAGEVTASQVQFTLGTLATGSYFARAKVRRNGIDSAWSSVLPVPISTVSGVVFDGDSITAGTGSTNQATDNVAAQFASLTGHTTENYGVSGQYVTDMIADYDTQIHPRFNASTMNAIVVQGGINDLRNSKTAVQLEASVGTYIGKAKTTGFIVAACTLLPVTADLGFSWDTGKEAQRVAYNTWVRAHWSDTLNADLLIDYAAMAEMQDPHDTSVYFDTVHPTTLGYSYIADEARKALGLAPVLKTITALSQLATTGLAYSSTLNNVSARSVVTASSSDGTVLTVTGTGTTRAISGTFSGVGTPNVTVTETLAGVTKATVLAFTIAAASTVTLSPLAKATDITLSTDKLTASVSSGATAQYNQIWGTASATPGVNTFTVKILAVGSTQKPVLGVAEPKGQFVSGWAGQNTSGEGWWGNTDVFIRSTAAAGLGTTVAVNDVYTIEYNTTAATLRVRKNGGAWASQSLTSYAFDAVIYPSLAIQNGWSVLVDFTGWATGTAPAKTLGTAAFNNGKPMTLSNGNLRATAVDTTVQQAASLYPIWGTVYAECTITTLAATNYLSMGILPGPAIAGLTGWSINGGGAAFFADGTVWGNAVNSVATGIGSLPQGTTVGIAVNRTLKKMWITKDGTNFYGAAGGPYTATQVAAGVGGYDFSWLLTTAAQVIRFAGGTKDAVNAMTWNFGGSTFAYTPPSGYVPL